MVGWAVLSRNPVMVVPGALTVIAAGLLFSQFQTRRSGGLRGYDLPVVR